MDLTLSALALGLVGMGQAVSSLPTPTAPPLSFNPSLIELEKKNNLNFDSLFPRRPFSGKSANGLKWSPDERFLAYAWNPYKEQGSDLYLYDTKSGESKRITSTDILNSFDRNLVKVRVQQRSDIAEWEKVEKMNDLEFREWRMKRAEDNRNRQEPLPSYSGAGQVEWAPNSESLLFVYRGDIFTYTVKDGVIKRITKTTEAETSPEFSPDGKGFLFARGSGIFRMSFDSPMVEQLNPPLPNGIPLSGWDISPDGNKLLIYGFRSAPAPRQVDYITYRGRFALAAKASRGVADDPFTGESYMFLYDIADGNTEKPKEDGKPWEIWAFKGGKEWLEAAVSQNPWSPDSKQFVFGSWKRSQKELEILVADVDTRKLKSVYKAKPDGEHTTPGMSDPFFTKDGDNVIAMLDSSGFRHAWMINPAKETVKPITSGEYELYPGMAQSADGKSLTVTASKEHPARTDFYRVDLSSKQMTRISKREGTYGTPSFSPKTNLIAANFGDWNNLAELTILGRDEKTVTQSHSGNLEKVNVLKPELFSYPNRNGQIVHGFIFKPEGWTKEQKRPLMIYVYGGPLGTGKSVNVGAFNSTAYLFNMYLTKVLGYITVTIDPRGQSGYGNVFGKANWEKPGEAQTEDLVDGVKYLRETYNVDPSKVGMNGWSFGGFQTQMCMFTAPDVFTLGIAGAGPTEWQNYNTWYSGGVIGPSANSKPEDLDKFSLTKLAKNLRSPLMLLHGMEDTNVLFQDTVKVYQKLLQYGRGPLVELAIDPTGGHGMGGDMDNRDRHAIYLGFLMKHWGPYVP